MSEYVSDVAMFAANDLFENATNDRAVTDAIDELERLGQESTAEILRNWKERNDSAIENARVKYKIRTTPTR